MTAPTSMPSQRFSPVRSWMGGRQAFDREALPVYCTILLLALFAAASVVFLGFGWDRSFVLNNVLALGTFLGIAFSARWLGFSRLGSVLEAWMLLLGVSALTAIGAFIAASANLPLIDDELAWVDLRLFGFTRALLASFADEWPLTFSITVEIYNTLSYQPFILLTVLLLSGQRQQAWLFLTAWSLALAICLAVSPLAPARGTPPYVLEWIDVFHGARDGTMRTLSAQVLTGIITFPSFHAAGAVVLAWGASKVRALCLPMIVLNALVVVSAVLVGGHYIVDVVAGIVVAIVAIIVAMKIPAAGARWHGGYVHARSNPS